MQPVIYTDLRCLQDRDYQRRGIGYHTAALLRARRNSSLANWRLIGLIDPQMAKVPADLLSIVDETSASLNPCFNSNVSLFIDGSPMTHDTRFSLRLQNHPQVLKAAVLYDFIPLDWPGYLRTTAKRIEYSAKIARLGKFDLFFPISAYTAWRLAELVGISGTRVKVTGACVRTSLHEARLEMAAVADPYEQPEPYFVTLGGDDRRKNTDVAVRAVKRLNLLYGRRIPLKVIGFYCDEYKSDLLRMAGHHGEDRFLEFYPNISDREVVKLHAGAVAAICPSRIEGFSLPIAEAAVCGCPVISSTCAAQIELITQPEALFHSEDHLDLAEKLEALLNYRPLRESLVAAQAHLARDFHADEVGRRFWSALEQALGTYRGAARISKPHRPRLAFVSPYPPDRSASAFYTAGIMQDAGAPFSSDLYSDSQRPLTLHSGFQDAGAVSIAPLLDGSYSAVISVLGNTPGQASILDLFLRWGGPCILHDVRLLSVYFAHLGSERFCDFAGTLLSRPIALKEAQDWLSDPNCTLLFLDEVIERASPLIVQTPTQRLLLKERYRVEAQVTTCCPTVRLQEVGLTASAKFAIREQLEIRAENFLISSFGTVARNKGMDTCILAIDLLRSWNIPAELYFVGDEHPPAGEIERVAKLYDISSFVHCGPEFASDESYRSFLMASDAAMQLRDYEFGQPSSPLINCAGAGLPAIATDDMGKSCETPDYVRRVPDRFSPLQVAEQLALIWENREDRTNYREARSDYLQRHSFEFYNKRLIEVLGLQ